MTPNTDREEEIRGPALVLPALLRNVSSQTLSRPRCRRSPARWAALPGLSCLPAAYIHRLLSKECYRGANRRARAFHGNASMARYVGSRIRLTPGVMVGESFGITLNRRVTMSRAAYLSLLAAITSFALASSAALADSTNGNKTGFNTTSTTTTTSGQGGSGNTCNDNPGCTTTTSTTTTTQNNGGNNSSSTSSSTCDGPAGQCK